MTPTTPDVLTYGILSEDGVVMNAVLVGGGDNPAALFPGVSIVLLDAEQGIGWQYDEDNGWTPPPAPVLPAVPLEREPEGGEP
jgi:hypothetical protein